MTTELTGYYIEEVTLQDVLDAKPTTIYYGANTCWWTHRETDLCTHPGCGLPCDPRSGMLFQTDDVEGFLKSAQDNADHYGKHGLKTFMAAHHGNVVVSKEDRKPTCFRTWDEYNAVLDRRKRVHRGYVQPGAYLYAFVTVDENDELVGCSTCTTNLSPEEMKQIALDSLKEEDEG